MAIKSVSSPVDVRAWDPDKPESKPFYFELLGETEPLLDGSFAELAIAPATDELAGAPRSSVYEYWWTIGHEGRPPGASGSRFRRWTGRAQGDWIWDRLDDHAAAVSVFFPTDGGWRANEVAAAVKYMSPVPHDPTFAERASGAMTTVEPLLQDAGKLVSLVQPAVGGVASKAAQTLDVLAQMKINQVPQVGGYAGAVSKVTTVSESGGVAYGVRWTLPKLMFRELGSRITGTVAVSFVPVTRQGDAAQPPQTGHIRAHASISPRGEPPIWVPSQSGFLALEVTPKLPASREPASHG
ncbi:MAG: hypothetical protein ACP5H2_12600 [Solirubrobacteraceae bacterium]